MIIGLSGKKGSGKNQVGDFIKELLTEEFYPDNQPIIKRELAKTLALADPIKQIACDYFGVDPAVAWGSQDDKENTITEWRWSDTSHYKKCNFAGGADDRMTVRELLQYIGTELFRQTMHNDFWVRATMNLIKGKYASFKHHIITDVRFPNECSGVRCAEGITVRIWRLGIKSTDQHASETSLDSEDLKLRGTPFYSNYGVWEVPPTVGSLFDYVIFNNGDLASLRASAKYLLKQIGLL